MDVSQLKRVNLASFRCSRERGRTVGEPAACSSVHGPGNRFRRGDPRGPAGIRPVETVPRDWHRNDHHKGWKVGAEFRWEWIMLRGKYEKTETNFTEERKDVIRDISLE